MYSNELKTASNLAKEALRITEWFRDTGFKKYTKKDDSPVTMADMAAQIFIVSEIRKSFPNDQIIGEEDASFVNDEIKSAIQHCFSELNINLDSELTEILEYKGTSLNRQWSIDPIDGTKGYAKGLDYSVGICFLENSDPKACAFSAPKYNERGLTIFIAEKGQGAKVSSDGAEFQPIKVSHQRNISEATICQSLHYNRPWVSTFMEKFGITKTEIIDSMLKFAKVADGTADLYLKPLDAERAFTWDYAPGYLIIEEAGGRITNLNGEPVSFKNEKLISKTDGLVISNGLLHEEVLKGLEGFELKY